MTYGLLLYFFNISNKFWPRGNTVWRILPFHRSYIFSFQGSNTNFHLKLIYFLVFKSLLKLYQGKYSLTHIVLSRILWKFPPKLIYLLVFKRLSKNCIWDITVWPILSFRGSNKNFYQFFLVFKNLFKQLYQGQYGLTHIVFSRILHKCSPNAHMFFGVKNVLKSWVRDSRVWPLFSFSRILSSFH